MSSLSHLLEYYSLIMSRQIVKYLPFPMVYGMGCFLGSIAYSVIGIRHNQVLKNLALAFPEKDDQWRNRIARETFQQSAVCLFEFLRMPEFDKKFIENHIKIEGLENLDKGFEHGKGVIMGTGHFSNWEMAGAVFPVLGYPTNFVMVEQHNLMVHALTNKYRMMHGINCISTGTGTKEIIKRLHRNELVCMLYDQDARKHGIFVDFFNHPASTHAGLALLSWKTGAPIVTAFVARISRDQFHLTIDPPIWADPGMDRHNAAFKLTCHLNKRLEEIIRQHPAQWFWYHRRWKTKK